MSEKALFVDEKKFNSVTRNHNKIGHKRGRWQRLQLNVDDMSDEQTKEIIINKEESENNNG